MLNSSITPAVKVVQTEAILFLKSMSERNGSDMSRQTTTLKLNYEFLERLKIERRFKFRIVICRIRSLPTLNLKIKCLGSGLPFSVHLVYHMIINFEILTSNNWFPVYFRWNFMTKQWYPKSLILQAASSLIKQLNEGSKNCSCLRPFCELIRYKLFHSLTNEKYFVIF